MFVLLLIVGYIAYNTYISKSDYQPVYKSTFDSNKVDFPSQYVKANRGEVNVEVPEVYELFYIISAISKPGQQGGINLNRSSAYYNDVINYFKNYSEHPAVKEYESLQKNNSYSNLRMIFRYEFEGNQVEHGGIYNQFEEKEEAESYAELLTDFAQDSNFREFYNNHSDYYKTKISNFQQLTNMKRIWSWMEKNFPQKYDSYKVVLSPLVYANHNTTNFLDSEDNYHEIVMFVSTPELFDQYNLNSNEVLKALVSRMVLTEIDHNYVNPTTDLKENMQRVNRVFSDLNKWNTQSGYRRSAITFNEYMTWGAACLYIYDHFSPEVYDLFIKQTKLTMQNRGFVKFNEFYEILFATYNSSEKPIFELYDEVLNKTAKI